MNKYTACGYSLFTHCSFDNNKNTHNLYEAGVSMKEFCAYKRDYATGIMSSEKYKMLLLTKKKKSKILRNMKTKI